MPWSDWITDPELRIHTVPRSLIFFRWVPHTEVNSQVLAGRSHFWQKNTEWIYYAEREDPKDGFSDPVAFGALLDEVMTDESYQDMIAHGSPFWGSMSGATVFQEVRIRCEWQIFPPLGPCDARWLIGVAFNTQVWDLTINYPIQWYPGGPSGKLSFTQRLPDHLDTLALGTDISQAPNGQYVEFEAGHSNNPCEFVSLEFANFSSGHSLNRWRTATPDSYHNAHGYPKWDQRTYPHDISADIYLVHNDLEYWDPTQWVGYMDPSRTSGNYVQTWNWPWRIPDGSSGMFNKIFDGMAEPLRTATSYNTVDGIVSEPQFHSRGPYTGSSFYDDYISPDDFGCITLRTTPPGMNKTSFRDITGDVYTTTSGTRPYGPLWVNPDPSGTIHIHSFSDTQPNQMIVKVRTPPYRYWIPDPVTPPPEDVPPRAPRPPLRLVSRTSKQLSDQRRVGENAYW